MIAYATRLVLCLTLVAAAGCSREKADSRSDDSPSDKLKKIELAAAAPEPKKVESKPKAEPSPKTATKEEPKSQPKIEKPAKFEPKPKKPLTFDEAWAEAIKLADDTDKNEPSLTAKAAKLLTDDERFEVDLLMKEGAVDLAESRGALVRKGFAAWVARQSRFVARTDKEFRPIAEKLWDRAGGPREILMMMNVWGGMDRFVRADVVAVVKNNVATGSLEEETRDAILLLRGEKWLSR